MCGSSQVVTLDQTILAMPSSQNRRSMYGSSPLGIALYLQEIAAFLAREVGKSIQFPGIERGERDLKNTYIWR